MRAAIKFGGQVDALARHYGIKGPHPGAILLKKVEKGESGGRGNAVSSAGARAWTQFMPATRAEYVRKYGIDPWRSESEALHATAIYLSHDKRGLAGYNPGDPTYTRYILSQKADLKGGAQSPSTPGRSGSVTTRTIPGGSKLHIDQAIIDTLSSHVKPGSLGKTVLNKLAYDPTYTTTTPSKTVVTHVPGAGPHAHAPPAQEGGVAHFDGKPVAPWIAAELRWARAHGWTGTVKSGYRSDAEQTAIYKSGVRPAAVPKSMGGGGSNHEGLVYPLGAVDVTQAQQLSNLLRRRGSKLVYAGAKDPVHFSHPHGGGY